MSEAANRTTRIERILDECIKLHAQDAPIDREGLIAAHPDLMPELGAELSQLAAIDAGVKGLELDDESVAAAATQDINVPVSRRVPPTIEGYEILRQIDLRRAEIAELRRLLPVAELRRVRRLAGLDESPSDIDLAPEPRP